MDLLTRYTFVSSFNKEKISKQEAADNGINSINFARCDKNGDNEISIEEILADIETCDAIEKAIQSKIDKITVEEQAVKSEVKKEEAKPSNGFIIAA